jgi:hypothetical protein
MIRKEENKYKLYSKDGSRLLGSASSLKQIEKREKQVNYFKHLRTKLKGK